jgi:uncharacterized protein (TIGR00251 family)
VNGQPIGDAISADKRGSVLSVTVAPRSSRSALERAADGTLRLRVAAPPVEGAANEAVLRFLASVLDVPRTKLAIVSGRSGRRKRILCEGVTSDEMERLLLGALGEQRQAA